MPWKKMRLRDAEVFARVDPSGAPRVEGGRVEVRYNARAPKAYRAAAANLTAIPGSPVLPDEHCADAVADDAPSGSSPVARKGKPAARGSKPGPVEAGTVVVYADGACSGNPGPAGLGVVIIDGPQRIERSEYLGVGTNNVAELTAVQRALEAVEDPQKPVAIHTDSQYAIGVLSLGWKAKANQALIGELRAMLRDRPNVRFVHVRGHSGVVLNERADELARKAVADRKTEHQVYRSLGAIERS